jgi:hypothetical protein
MHRLALVLFSGLCVAGVATVSAADPAPAVGNVVLEETFEDANAPLPRALRAELSREEPGADGSHYAVKVVPTEPGGVVRFDNVTLAVGETYKVSAKVKLSDNAVLRVGQFLVIFPLKNSNDTAYVQVTIPDLNLNSSDWTLVEGRFTFDGEGSIAGDPARVSVGNKGMLFFRPSSSGEFAEPYFVDDFKLETVPVP